MSTEVFATQILDALKEAGFDKFHTPTEARPAVEVVKSVAIDEGLDFSKVEFKAYRKAIEQFNTVWYDISTNGLYHQCPRVIPQVLFSNRLCVCAACFMVNGFISREEMYKIMLPEFKQIAWKKGITVSQMTYPFFTVDSEGVILDRDTTDTKPLRLILPNYATDYVVDHGDVSLDEEGWKWCNRVMGRSYISEDDLWEFDDPSISTEDYWRYFYFLMGWCSEEDLHTMVEEQREADRLRKAAEEEAERMAPLRRTWAEEYMSHKVPDIQTRFESLVTWAKFKSKGGLAKASKLVSMINLPNMVITAEKIGFTSHSCLVATVTKVDSPYGVLSFKCKIEENSTFTVYNIKAE